MTTTPHTDKGRFQSGNFCEANTTGAGGGGGAGLTSLQDAFAIAAARLNDSLVNVAGDDALRNYVAVMEAQAMRSPVAVHGLDAMTMNTALASAALPVGDLLQAVQIQQDLLIVERSAYKLRARMQGDGRIVGDDTFKDAKQAAAVALVQWRAGVTVTRTDDGGECLSASDANGEKNAARVAWRALVSFLSSDYIGDTIQIQGGCEDDWIFAQALPSESRYERRARWSVESKRGLWFHLLASKIAAAIQTGRGRRKAGAWRVENALRRMIAGESLDDAAIAAGYKMRGRNRPGDALLQQCKRLGFIADNFTMPRRARG